MPNSTVNTIFPQSLLSAQEIAQFHRDGFILGPQVLSDAGVEELRDELTRVINDHGKADRPQPTQLANLGEGENAPVWQIVNIWQASAAYKRLVHHRAICDTVAGISEAKELRLWHDQIQYKPKKCGGVNMWHQDNPLWPPLSAQTQITAWVALDDVAEDNGCMSMVPGTHRLGNTQEFLSTLDDYHTLPKEHLGLATTAQLCPVKKGYVHFHHGLTWHGSHNNTSGRPRRAIALHYMTEDTRFVAEGHHLCREHISSQPGEKVQGERLLKVYPV